jgi:hypothetical protein
VELTYPGVGHEPNRAQPVLRHPRLKLYLLSPIMKTPKPEQPSDPPVEHPGPRHEEIASRAYQLWEERGGPHGSPEEDWHRAQRELRVRSGAQDDAEAARKEATE